MANTPNINLVKPFGTDKALVSVINDNSDKIDTFAGSANTNMANTQNGYAIVVDGNNAPKAITAGQYLFIKNHSTLSAGGYHATANIANGAAITSSNVAADADGVVNGAFSALNGKTVQHGSNIVKAEVISDETNHWGLSLRKSNNVTYFLRAREDGTVGLDKNNGSSWSTVYELAKLSMLAGGNIVFRTNGENTTSYTFSGLPRINESSYKYYILVCGDPPSNNYAVIVGGLTTNNVDSHKFVIGDATMFAYTASVSNGAITFNFTETRYGGVRLFWLS